MEKEMATNAKKRDKPAGQFIEQLEFDFTKSD